MTRLSIGFVLVSLLLSSPVYTQVGGEWTGALVRGGEVYRTVLTLWQNNETINGRLDFADDKSFGNRVTASYKADSLLIYRYSKKDTARIVSVYRGVLRDNVFSGRYGPDSLPGQFLFVLDKTVLAMGQSVPQREIPSLDDPAKKLSLNDHPGKFLLVDFWATYCKTCIPKREEIDSVTRKHGSQLAVMSISLDKEPATVRTFRSQRFAMPWQHACVENNFNADICRVFGVDRVGTPSLFLIAPDGRLIAKTPELLSMGIDAVLNQYVNR